MSFPGSRGASTRAIVLRSSEYGENSKVVTLLSEDFGKVEVFARRTERSSSTKGRGLLLQSLCVLDVELLERKSSLWSLRRAEVQEHFPDLLRHFTKLSVASAALRFLRQCAPLGVVLPQLFAETRAMLRGIDALAVGESPTLVYFAYQMRVLSALGLAPSLEACGGCGRRPAADQAAGFDASRGQLICRACGGSALVLNARVRKALSDAQGAEFAPELWRWSASDVETANRALGEFVLHHLGVRYEAPAAKSFCV